MTRFDPLAFIKSLKDPSAKTVIRVPSDVRRLKEVSSRVLSALERYDLDEGKMFDIRLCVEEAVRNAMVHGNRSDKALSVKTSFRIDDGTLNIEVEDEGGGFDSASVKDPTAGANLLKNSGRGVYLIKKLMDKVEYNEKGNRITMVKRI